MLLVFITNTWLRRYRNAFADFNRQSTGRRRFLLLIPNWLRDASRIKTTSEPSAVLLQAVLCAWVIIKDLLLGVVFFF